MGWAEEGGSREQIGNTKGRRIQQDATLSASMGLPEVKPKGLGGSIAMLLKYLICRAELAV